MSVEKAAKTLDWASSNLEDKLKERAAIDEKMQELAHNQRVNDHALNNARMSVQAARDELQEEIDKVSERLVPRPEKSA